MYLNEKSVKYAERKRLGEATEGSSSSQHDAVKTTRQNSGVFDPKMMCIMCNKHWFQGKQPMSKVSTKNSQNAIEEKAKQLGRNDILFRLIGQGHDMIANDIAYHKSCMNKFKAQRVPSGESKPNPHDAAFSRLVIELEAPLFQDLSGFLVKSLCDHYRDILRELGVDLYRSHALKLKLQQHFGSCISILEQTWGSGFICASNVPLGDALEKVRRLEDNMDEKYHILQKAAKIIRADCHKCKKQSREKHSTDISLTSASQMVPDSLFNFTGMQLYDRVLEFSTAGRVIVDQATTEKSVIISEHILQNLFGVPTPLGIATAYHIFNQTRSKSLITLNNRLGLGISYERLQRQLTAESEKVMLQVETDSVYVPEAMTKNCKFPHVFAMDNLDWKEKTLGGGSFHATTALIVENRE